MYIFSTVYYCVYSFLRDYLVSFEPSQMQKVPRRLSFDCRSISIRNGINISSNATVDKCEYS